MKIAAAVPLYPPTSRVGAWLATHACLAGMVARGHEVDVVTYLSASNTNAYVLDGVRVHPLCRIEQVAQDADVVVSHLGDNQQATKWARFTGKPTVRMVHGMPVDGQELADDLAVFNSHSLREAVGWSGRSVVVHPPIDVDLLVTPGPLVTLVNLAPDKGGHVFWNLVKTNPGTQFLGVRGGYGQQVSDKAKNATIVDPVVDIAGDVFSRTRILLMPSLHETWGMVGMEAMACGIPVIAHPTPGLRESLGDAGTFVDRDDLAGWSAAIARLNRQPVWEQASTAARRRAAAFDSEAQLDAFAAALESLVAVPA